MVASRCPYRFFPAAFMSRSTSRSVRYCECDIRHSVADQVGLFSLQWLERWRAILISLAIFPVLCHDCSYNGHCKHSLNHRRHPVMQQRVAALALGELATSSNGT